MGKLEDQLKSYTAGELYPLHMPGHKRRLSMGAGLPFAWDVTEVPGVDDLHDASGILQEAMVRTAALHGAARTWYLVNGSTCGLLAGIRALAPAGSEILAARNCHKAVYHAMELGGLRAHYLTPDILPDFGIYGSISPDSVRQALKKFPEIRCVVITSPTYEGVLSDIPEIARICHSCHIPLLVDEAHGAHLGLFAGWPDSALHQGADLVVQSAHKTLPSLTQTAFLHLSKNSLANPDEVERQLDIFETSSPSYPLMASLDGCTQLLLQQGDTLFEAWKENLEAFDRTVSSLSHLHVLFHGTRVPGIYGFDPGKLPVSTGGTAYTGTSLAAALRQRFAFETEMACGSLVLAMTGMADSRDALIRFGQALVTLDRESQPGPSGVSANLSAPGSALYSIGEAVIMPMESINLSKAAGRICGEYIWAYPPGVPLAVPGEAVTEELIRCMNRLESAGTALHHSHCRTAGAMELLL